MALRDECGFDFPADFKIFMEEYGGGVIEDALWLPSFVGGLDDWRDEYANAREELHYGPEDAEVQPAGSAVEVPESAPLVPWAVYDGGFSWFLTALILGEVANPFGVEIAVGGGHADYLNRRDEKTLRREGVWVGGYVHDRREFFSHLFAAGHDPVHYFPSAARVEGPWRA